VPPPKIGTGILKVTPVHDPSDFEIAGRLGLDPVNVFNPDGTINANGGPFEGRRREAARAAVVERLDEEGLLGEIRDYTFRAGHCDRCGTVIGIPSYFPIILYLQPPASQHNQKRKSKTSKRRQERAERAEMKNKHANK
jgi:valyl-tRNA synthetase